MATIVIDNIHIDLEMITHVKLELPPSSWRPHMNIYTVGNQKPISIERIANIERVNKPGKAHFNCYTSTIYSFHFKDAAQGDKQARNIISSRSLYNVRKMKARLAPEQMFAELMRRWQPSMLKFDDITIKYN
jgi:hypothetical protein